MKRTILIIAIAIFTIGIGFVTKEVSGAWESYNIGGIDEDKFPGYKSQIQALQSQYPNWTFKLLYTGINWEDAINGEYVGHGESPSSLIQDSYSGEWICPICGYTKYDVSHEWYCASKEAIRYMMDPRNSLTADYMFQFQDLGSSAGTRSEIVKMVSGTFLNNEECINAIMEAAQEYRISPFHLISRIRQEQGPSGSGNMNGYLYNGVVVYNLFNINVSGNTEEGFLAGAAYAYQQGWTSRAKSIKGGAKFLREKYLNGGQTTLYFQKYNVVDQNNLYQHQYMQNIRAANDEGNTIYKAYKSNGVLNSHFEFTIPMYENMPKNACPRPLKENEAYTGDISSQIIDFQVNKNSSGAEYIAGNIMIIEWINGNSTVPRTIPKMTIESTDGSIKQELYVNQVSGNTYYFDKYINSLDKSRTYVIKAELTERANQSNHKTMTVQLPNKTFSNSSAYSQNGCFYAGTYEGGLTHALNNISLNKTSNGNWYISGKIMVIEWINGVSNVPRTIPKMTLKATDGSETRQLYVRYENYNDYYFDIFMDDVNTGKEYTIEIELTEQNNTSKTKKNTVKIPNQTMAEFKNKNMVVKDNTIKFEYEGTIATKLNQLAFHKNSDTSYYISGEVEIKEMIKGQNTIPETLPKIILKATDGTVAKEMYSKRITGNNYYFDGYINGLDKTKEYELMAELTELNNKASHKKEAIKVSDRTLGQEGKVDIVFKNNRLKYQYDGGLTNQLYSLKLNQTADGSYYINGEIMAIEWVNGQSTVPIDKPKMTLVSTDGTTKMEAFVTPTGTNTYYFDKFIDGIDVNKQYQIKIELTTSYNVSKNKVNTVNLSNMNSDLGKYKTSKMQIENNKIVFKDMSYKGDVNTELYQFSKGESNGVSYISGEIVVVEWINGQSTVPKEKPKMTFVSTDGKVNMEVFVTATGTNTYYFDRFIDC